MWPARSILVVLSVSSPWLLAAAAEVVILQIRVVEGEGLARTAGARDSRPLTVQISDETGKPVAGAKVSFRLPEEGPGGIFRNGLATEVVVTGADGLATVKGIRWRDAAGPFQIRVIAARDRARAGIAVPQYLSSQAGRRTASR